MTHISFANYPVILISSTRSASSPQTPGAAHIFAVDSPVLPGVPHFPSRTPELPGSLSSAAGALSQTVQNLASSGLPARPGACCSTALAQPDRHPVSAAGSHEAFVTVADSPEVTW